METLSLIRRIINLSMKIRIFSVQCFSSCNCCNKGTSKENPSQELGSESLQHRRWFRKLSTFHKIFKNLHVLFLCYYLFKPPCTTQDPRSSRNMFFFILNTIFSKTFFPSAVSEWNVLDKSLRNSESLRSIFKKGIVKFI